MKVIKERFWTQLREDVPVQKKIRALSEKTGLSMNYIRNDILKKYIDKYAKKIG